MIFGRPPALVMAIVQAALNVLVFVFGVHLDGQQIGMLNVLAGAVVVFAAYNTDHAALAAKAADK